MGKPNVDADSREHERRMGSADGKIGVHQDRMKAKPSSARQHAEDQLLMNEMRGNKAVVDLNSALYEYDTGELRKER